MSVGWSDAGLDAPAWLGPYRIAEPLGRGGTGIVFRAFDEQGQAVALKTVHRATPDAYASLRAEVHALRRVRHAGIVGVLGDGVDRGRPWFAMELVHGETLAAKSRALVRSGAWTAPQLREVVGWIAAICEPLAALHDSGLVHRDLKPDNIFIRPDGQPVLVDLGLARGYGGDTRAVVEAYPVAGTLAYMAPEQLAGGLGDARTDLYALGCILFELLLGSPPQPELGVDLRGQVGGIPPELEVLVKSLLQPRPRDRIGHAEDVRMWLATHVEQSLERHSHRGSDRLYRPLLAGRRDLLRQLLADLEASRAGRGGVVLLEGPSGIGKSHLASELGRIAAQDGVVIAVSTRPSDGAPQAPLACWAPLFDHAVDRALIAPASPVAVVLRRDDALVRGLHRAFDRLPESPQLNHVAPSGEEVISFVRDLIGAVAEEAPTLMLLDDLQWADELTLGIVKLIAGPWSRRRRMLVIATLRSDEVSTPFSEPARRLTLGPLSTHEIREVVAEMLGVGEAPETVADWVARHADGNPFLAAEYLRLLLSELPLERELALPHVRLRAPSADALDRLPTPTNVRELVLRRLHSLDPAAFALAELIAVLGGALDRDVLSMLLSARPDAMFELDRAQVLEATVDGARRLSHDRIRVVLYDNIAAPRRCQLHREAGELLESSALQDRPFGAIAHHYLRAGDSRRAFPHLERAGHVALARAAYDAAAIHFADVFRVAGELEAHGDTFDPGRRAKWSLGAARASYCRGESARCESHVRDTLALIGRSLPRDRLGWASLVVREAIASQLQASHGDRDGLFGDAALATSLLPYRYFFSEDLIPLVATALLAANLARRGDARDQAAAPRSLLAAIAGLCRLTGVARRNFDTAAASAERCGDWREAAQVRALESIYQGSFGRMHEAEVAATSAVEYCQHTNDAWVHENVETTYAHVAYYTGKLDDARRRASLVARSANERHNVQHEIWGLFLQARSDVATANWDSAERLLRSAFDLLEQAPELISELAVRALFARVLVARGNYRDAERHAAWVTEQVRRRSPSAYPSLIAYTSAAEVWRLLVRADATKAREAGSRAIGLALWRFAVLYPIALPAALGHTGVLFEHARLPALSDRCVRAAIRRSAASGLRNVYEPHAQEQG